MLHLLIIIRSNYIKVLFNKLCVLLILLYLINIANSAGWSSSGFQCKECFPWKDGQNVSSRRPVLSWESAGLIGCAGCANVYRNYINRNIKRYNPKIDWKLGSRYRRYTKTAACDPGADQSPVVPGDTIDLKGPDVPDDQKALGVRWLYQWTVKENNACGRIVAQGTDQAFSFSVPTTGYASAYYIDLMVTAIDLPLCIDEACMRFPIKQPGACTITTDKPTKVCIEDTAEYTYSTADTPVNTRQRWWIFPASEFPDPSLIKWGEYGTYKVGNDKNRTIVSWNTFANGNSSTYTIFTGYYAKNAPDASQGSCQLSIIVVDVPSAAIAIQ